MNYKEIGNIIFKSGKESLNGRYWKWLFGSLPALCAVLLFGKNFLDQNLTESARWAAIIIGIFIFLRFGIRIIINSFKYLHHVYTESVYGDSIIRLKESFGKVHFTVKRQVIKIMNLLNLQ